MAAPIVPSGDLPVVVVHYNAPDWLKSSVASIQASEGVTPRVLVVDNSGNAPQIEGVEVLRTGANLGYSGGANAGLRRWIESDGGEFCVVASHDLHPEPDALARLLATAESDPSIGLLGPAVNDIRGEEFDGTRDVPWVSGSCILLRRGCVVDVSLFDEAFGSYTEDVDLGWRVSKSRWRVALCGEAEVHGLGSSSPTARKARFVNHMYLEGKHGGWRGLARHAFGVTPWLVVKDLVAGTVHRDRTLVARAATRVQVFPAGVRKGITGARRLG